MGTLTSFDIKQKAASLGFDLCGIASAESFPELAFLQEWLDRGFAGDMDRLKGVPVDIEPRFVTAEQLLSSTPNSSTPNSH